MDEQVYVYWDASNNRLQESHTTTSTKHRPVVKIPKQLWQLYGATCSFKFQYERQVEQFAKEQLKYE